MNGLSPKRGKRSNYISWDEYFMSIAVLTSYRSKDPNTQVGACVINKSRKIIGIGYNGMPTGCSDDLLPWNNCGDWINTKYPYVCHAEMNAILNRNSLDQDGLVMYTTLFPCNECAKIIIQSNIKDVVYLKMRRGDIFHASLKLFELANVTHRQFVPSSNCESITISYD